MKKLLLLALTFCITAHAQKKQGDELMYMVLENFTYKPNTSKLKFDLVIKNNSDKTLYFIKPKNFLFSNHNDNGYLEDTYNLYSKPYYIHISPYKNCYNLENVVAEAAVVESVKEAVEEVEEAENAIEIVEVEEIEETVESAVDAVKDDKREYEDTVIESTEAQDAFEGAGEAVAYNHNKAYKIIEEVIEIPAREYRKFKNIEIDRSYGTFCKNVNYKITVDYYSRVNPFDYYSIKIYKERLKNNYTEAINTLFENEFKLLKKEGVNNKENLQNILKIYDGLIETNGTKFYSNTAEKTIN